ncbi:MAG: oxidoreductase, partial [Promethearchaeota archaeon]
MFSKIKIGDLTLKNRIVMPPMCMYSADEKGFPTNFHFIHYGNRALGGVGLIIMEATAVKPIGRISNHDLGIWSDEHVSGLKSIVDLVHEFGGHIGIQLAHAGRKTETGKGVSSWDIAYSDKYPTPEKMTEKQIQAVIHAFGDGARRAQDAGFDMIEIHGAHGYLINQFLTPLINKRDDVYGCKDGFGIKFLQDIIRTVKENCNLPISLRISSEEFKENGLHPMDFIRLVEILQRDEKTRIDLLNVSSGGVFHTKPNIPIVPGYQTAFAQEIKQGIDVPVLSGGLLSGFDEVESILNENKADMVWLGRE